MGVQPIRFPEPPEPSLEDKIGAVLERFLEAIQLPPQVTVEAPQVRVSPRIDVPACEHGDPDFSALLASQAVTNQLLAELVLLLRAPVTRRVERGPGGLIDMITESR